MAALVSITPHIMPIYIRPVDSYEPLWGEETESWQVVCATRLEGQSGASSPQSWLVPGGRIDDFTFEPHAVINYATLIFVMGR